MTAHILTPLRHSDGLKNATQWIHTDGDGSACPAPSGGPCLRLSVLLAHTHAGELAARVPCQQGMVPSQTRLSRPAPRPNASLLWPDAPLQTSSSPKCIASVTSSSPKCIASVAGHASPDQLLAQMHRFCRRLPPGYLPGMSGQDIANLMFPKELLPAALCLHLGEEGSQFCRAPPGGPFILPSASLLGQSE